MSSEQIKIKLVPIADISTESQLRIREIRNEDGIRKWMFTDHVIELNEHLAWLSRLKEDKKQLVFAVINAEEEPLGVVSVNALDQLHRKTDWAYYLTEKARGGLGSALEFEFIDFVFNKLNMNKLNCEVLEGNEAVVKLHEKFLFKKEGFRASNIIKDNERIGVHLLGLTKDEWNHGKQGVLDKYQKFLNKFCISIEWGGTDQEKKKHPLDEIESARARNNLNWMNILRLVLELSPEHGKALVTDIRNIDKEISMLTDKLIEGEEK